MIALELSRLAAETEHPVGKATEKVKHHHDMSDAMTLHFQQNVGKVKEILKVHNPFDVERDDVIVNIITQAVMSDSVEMAIIQRHLIGQEMFDKFVQQRLTERELSI